MRNETFQYHTIICNHRFPASLAVALVLQFLCRKAGEDSLYPIGDFAQMGQEEGKGSVRRDLAGNIYSEAAFDSILPMFYFRQLMSDERFPDTIQGIAVTPKMVQTENFNFRSVPSDINAPSIGLYPLMESMSG